MTDPLVEKLKTAAASAMMGSGIWLKGIKVVEVPPGFLSETYEWCYRIILTDGRKNSIAYIKKSWVEAASDIDLHTHFKPGVNQWRGSERLN